jgi:hypothetical protein
LIDLFVLLFFFLFLFYFLFFIFLFFFVFINSPQAKRDSGLAYDTKRNQLILFAGRTFDADILQGLFCVYSFLSNFVLSFPFLFIFVYFRIFLFIFRLLFCFSLQLDLWLFNLNTSSWVEISMSGSWPSKRFSFVNAYDNIRDQYVLATGEGICCLFIRLFVYLGQKR